MRPLAIDLFCCQGGMSAGLHRAGFDVVGVDLQPQPRYPFQFLQADALEYLRRMVDGDSPLGWPVAVHASPPCQFATRYKNNRAHVRHDHPNLIPQTRALLEELGLPYTIENVEDARDELHDPAMICGTGLGVRVRRHRLFEANWPLVGVDCDHGRFTDRIFPGSSNRPNGRTVCNIGEYRVPLPIQREVMQMPWASLYGLSQAVHPAYAEHVGRQLLQHVGRAAA